MKKRDLIVTGVALVGGVVGMVNMQGAYAAIGCTSGTNSTPMVCTGTTGTNSYLAQDLAFTGSNGVQMNVDDTTAIGVSACASHISGRNAYGLTTNGGSMQVKSGGTANTVATYTTGLTGGCQ